MNTETHQRDPGFLKTLSSIQFGITVLVAIALVSIVGTIVPQGRPASFYLEQYGHVINFLITVFRFDITYHSPIFIGLLVLLFINLVLCSLMKFPAKLRATFKSDRTPDAGTISRMSVYRSLKNTPIGDVERAFNANGFHLRQIDAARLYGEKNRLGYLGSSFVHLSLIVILTGGLVSLVTGKRGYIVLEKGETTAVAKLSNDQSIPLGFAVTLNEFTVDFYPDYPGRPKSFTSSITVTDSTHKAKDMDVRVNHPLMRNGFTIYQQSYGTADGTASAENDTARVAVSLRGLPAEVPPLVTLDMLLNEDYPVPGFGDSLSVRVVELHRDFQRIQSVSGERNPAVRIEVLVHGKPRWSVYAFENFPGMNMPMQPDLALLFTLREIVPGGESEPDGYYTVLGVVRDRGVPFIWFGALIMMVGLLLSFYLRPRRLWVYDDGGTIMIGGRTKGDPGTFREFIDRTLKKIEGHRVKGDA